MHDENGASHEGGSGVLDATGAPLAILATVAPTRAQLLDAALAYAARGWPVLPLHYPTGRGCSCIAAQGAGDRCEAEGKHPAVTRGAYAATTEPAILRKWWERRSFNLGVATGRGLLVVDVDPRHGGDESLDELVARHGRLPATVEACTGGRGRHLLFRVEGYVPCSVGKLGRGIDVRGDGGLIVAPPSLHASGRVYGWELSSDPAEVAIAEAPGWLLDLCRGPLRAPRRVGAQGRALAQGEPIPEGERNATLYRRACSFRAMGLDEDEVAEALAEENEARCKPPLGWEEVEAIASKAARHLPGLSPAYERERARGEASFQLSQRVGVRFGDARGEDVPTPPPDLPSPPLEEVLPAQRAGGGSTAPEEGAPGSVVPARRGTTSPRPGTTGARVVPGPPTADASTGDPIANLAARVGAEGPAVAFDPSTLDAAVRLREGDPATFASLRAELKRSKGFPLTPWSKALDTRARELRAEAKERAQQAATEHVASTRAAAVAARAEAADDVAVHYGEHVVDDDTGACFVMKPGRITALRVGKDGREETRMLAAFSASIVADVHELDAPDARMRRAFDLSVMLPGDTAPWRVDGVTGEEFRMMHPWLARLPAAAVVHDTGRCDDLRVAVQSMSVPTTVHRYRFTGWTMHQGRPVYLHAGGAIGEDGPVTGLRAEAEGPASRFDLGELADDTRTGVGAVLDLLSVSPSTVVAPMVSAAFRAAMGRSRLTVHVSGRTGTGKSTLAALVQSLFGRSFRGDSLPTSWADGSTSNGIARVIARVGDAVVTVDDLRFGGGPGDAKVSELFDRVTRAQFNGASPVKLTRDGGQRVDPPSRSVILSTGETPPRQHSTRNRVVCVELNERPSPDLSNLMQRAAAGDLARGMTSFVHWYAARYCGNLARLDAMERATSVRWCLGVTDRAAGLFGALALGAEVMFAWLAESGVDAAVIAHHEARTREALTAVAHAHGEGVEAENPALRFIPLLREAFIAGEAHVKGLRPDGRSIAPTDAELWGWRTDGHDGPKHQGKGVGWVRGAEVYIDPGVALDVVKTRALRAGDPVALDKRGLARDLHAAGLLARTTLHVTSDPRHTCKVRVGAGVQPWVLVFGVGAFGMDEQPDEGDAAPPDEATG